MLWPPKLTDLNNQVGDIIRLDKNDKTTNLIFDVETTITATASFFGLNIVTTNTPVSANSLTPGVLTSDTGNIIELRRRVGTTSILTAFNGTKQYDELLSWNSIFESYLVGLNVPPAFGPIAL